MAELSKKAAEKAYQAGHALVDVTSWPSEVPVEKRGPGVHHCPFAEGDPQRDHWLRGLRDRLSEPRPDPADVLRDIDAELGGKS